MFLILFLTQILFAENLSEVVGAVDKLTVTSRDVRADWIVENLLFVKTPQKAPLTAAVSSDLFDRELNRILMEHVVFQESKLFKVVEVSDDSAKAKANELRDKLTKQPALNNEWKQLQITSSELVTIVTRKLQAKNFIEFKAKASLIPVTEAEAFDYYKNNRKRFGTKPYKDFKDNIKNFLAKQQADQRLSEWFGVLKKKYQVRKVFVN